MHMIMNFIIQICQVTSLLIFKFKQNINTPICIHSLRNADFLQRVHLDFHEAMHVVKTQVRHGHVVLHFLT